MEKLIYTVWGTALEAAAGEALRGALTTVATAAAVQVNLPDVAFSGGQGTIRNLLPAFDGIVSLWLDSRRQRHDVESVLSRHGIGFHGYAVCESEPMPSRLPAPDDTGRVATLSQVCLLHKPDAMAYDPWLHSWVDLHTDIAIECQSTVAYRQNIVQHPITEGAAPIHGIVEECFPPQAYADVALFFGAPNDPERMQTNIARLMESTARFAPVECLDRIFTARYDLPAPTALATGE